MQIFFPCGDRTRDSAAVFFIHINGVRLIRLLGPSRLSQLQRLMTTDSYGRIRQIHQCSLVGTHWTLPPVGQVLVGGTVFTSVNAEISHDQP